jgi:hypothetical protein
MSGCRSRQDLTFQYPCSLRSDKGTGVRYEISGASAPFCPSPPLPPSPASGRGGNLSLGEPPFASTPLSHPVGEGLGVRAKKRAHLAHSELKRCTLTSSLRFPLQAGGTAWTRGSVPLAKRGQPKGGGQFINSERAIGMRW